MSEIKMVAKEKKSELSPPWWEFYHKLDAMFGSDPEIHMEFNDDDEDKEIKMFVDSQAKADALMQVLPMEKDYGNVKLKLTIVPSDKAGSIAQLYKTIFNGNPVFSDAVEVDQPGYPHFSYVVFKPLIVQFYDDNLMDVNGNVTTLHQDIARDLFESKDGVYFCTESIRPPENK